MNFRAAIPDYVRAVMEKMSAAGHEIYVVGGAVRDLASGKVPDDYDLTTSASPEETIGVLERYGIRYADTGLKHGTVMAVTEGKKVEITSFRTDGEYNDKRHPDGVIFIKDINEDVKRRDFTINAMYLDADGGLTDPEGGLKDLEAKIIRAVGDPGERFREDALRILRALRFQALTGFEIEAETGKAMIKEAPGLRDISVERTASEFKRILTGEYASKAVRGSVDIISIFIPELKACEGFDQRSPYHDLDVLEHTLAVIDNIPLLENGRRDEALALAAFFHDIAKPLCFYLGENGTGHMKGHPIVSRDIAVKRLNELKFPPKEIKEISDLVLMHDTFIKPGRTVVRKLMAAYPAPFLDKLEILQRADILAHAAPGQLRMEKLTRISSLRRQLIDEETVTDIKDLDINGNDIIALGVKPGPAVGAVIDCLWEDYLSENVDNNKADLLERARLYVTFPT